MSVKIKKEWFEDSGVIRQRCYVSGNDLRVNLKEKVLKTIDLCSGPEGNDCQECPYYNKYWENCNEAILANEMMTLIKAYDFALSQYKETLEELIENNDGDVKDICVFLLNLLRIKEVDIEKGFYI